MVFFAFLLNVLASVQLNFNFTEFFKSKNSAHTSMVTCVPDVSKLHIYIGMYAAHMHFNSIIYS